MMSLSKSASRSSMCSTDVYHRLIRQEVEHHAQVAEVKRAIEQGDLLLVESLSATARLAATGAPAHPALGTYHSDDLALVRFAVVAACSSP